MAVVDNSALEYWLRRLHRLISPYFTRSEPRQRAWNYMCGLVGIADDPGTGRRNIASYADEVRADGAQRLLRMAQWDEQEVRRTLLELVKRQWGGTGGGLCVAEVTFVKKGSAAMAVERQFSVDSRRLENCQIALLMFYSAPSGALVLIDAVPYVPPSWLADAERRRRASIPADIGYRTKSRIAVGMVERAVESGMDPQWTSCALLCSDKISLRRALYARGVPYLVSLTSGEFEGISGKGPDDPAEEHFCQEKSPRSSYPGHHRLTEQYLVRPASGRCSPRSLYYCAATRPTAANCELNDMISTQKRIETRWRAMRAEIRLDRYEVRSWRGWHRHMTLVMVVQTAVELARKLPAEPNRTMQ